jgi:uncharacterized protein YciI
MYFVLLCKDRPDAVGVRAANREAHLAYARASGVVRIAGPTTTEDGAAMTGSVLVIEVADRAAAEAFAAADPYAKAGLFESVAITPWRWVIGAPETA